MTEIVTIGEELNRVRVLLSEAGVESPQLDAEVLMAHATGSSRMHVISHPEARLTDEEVKSFRDMVDRRLRREPLPYITGRREFWGLEFEVTPAVLIPRPETETLIDAALAQLRGKDSPLIADIGAGSGCVAVALAVELPDAVVYATELSPQAAEVARRNAEKHQVESRVSLMEGDLLDPLPQDVKGRLDAIVSNPPYIPSDEIDRLQPEIVQYEPRGALDGGPDGMKYHRLILEASRDWLRPVGWVHMEVEMGQAGSVAEYARSLGYVETKITDDLAGIGRVVSAEKGAGGRVSGVG